MRRPGPVRPRMKDARAYYADMRVVMLQPLFDRFRDAARRMGTQEFLTALMASRWEGMVEPETIEKVVRTRIGEMERYHRARFIQTMRSVGVHLRSFFSRAPDDVPPVDLGAVIGDDPELLVLLTERIEQNVALIKTIPVGAHAGLARRIQALLVSDALDQRALMRMIAEQYKVEGYNLRRITRDQTNKTIAALSQHRQRKVGVTRYRWMTAGDERVRATHAALDGEVFAWDSPPAIGHPGEPIQCRCVPQAILDDLL